MSTFTLVSGPLDLSAKQTLSGSSPDQFYETSGGSSHSRFVRAVNGSIVIDSEAGAQPGGLQVGWSLSAGGSVKGVLGRGPGELGH